MHSILMQQTSTRTYLVGFTTSGLFPRLARRELSLVFMSRLGDLCRSLGGLWELQACHIRYEQNLHVLSQSRLVALPKLEP